MCWYVGVRLCFGSVLKPTRRPDLGPVRVFEWSREAVVPEVGERLEGTI